MQESTWRNDKVRAKCQCAGCGAASICTDRSRNLNRSGQRLGCWHTTLKDLDPVCILTVCFEAGRLSSARGTKCAIARFLLVAASVVSCTKHQFCFASVQTTTRHATPSASVPQARAGLLSFPSDSSLLPWHVRPTCGREANRSARIAVSYSELC